MQILDEITCLPNEGSEIQYPDEKTCSILVLIPVTSEFEEEKAFLTKVFAAAQKQMDDDVYIWPLPSGIQLAFPSLHQHFQFTDLYLFGVLPEQIGLQTSLPRGIPVHLGEILIYSTDAPLKVSNNNDIKKPLWELLRTKYTDADIR